MLEGIKNNFSRLIALYETERERGNRLSMELEQCRAENEASQKQIADLKAQIETLRLKGAFTGSGDSSTASKEKLDKLIKEIDKCISLLEKD